MKRVFSIVSAVSVCAALCVALAACGGPDKNKVDKVQTDYAALVNEANEASRLFNGALANGVSIEQSVIDEYNKTAGLVNEFGVIKLDDKKDAELDGYLSDISEYRSTLRAIRDELESSIAEHELKEDNAEEARSAEDAELMENAEDEGDVTSPSAEENGNEDGGLFYVGIAGDDSTMFTVALSISPDGDQCVYVAGIPGDSHTVFGQIIDSGDGNLTIYPLDNGEPINISLVDNGDGTFAFEVGGYQGSLDQVNEEEFQKAIDLLG